MKTAANLLISTDRLFPSDLYSLKSNQHPQVVHLDKLSDECIWQNFMANHRIIHLFRPDYFMIYKCSKSAILYQQNINLDLGTNAVSADKIMSFIPPVDLQHIRSMDRVVWQITAERRLQPLEYIYKIYGNIVCPNPFLKRIMRTSFLLHSDSSGHPDLIFFCFHDVSKLVSGIRPNNYTISFDPGQAHLGHEVDTRLKKLNHEKAGITPRELEIIKCLNEGMNSREIAPHLFISKATVDTHRQNMLRKWELPNTAALLKRAREEDWI